MPSSALPTSSGAALRRGAARFRARIWEGRKDGGLSAVYVWRGRGGDWQRVAVNVSLAALRRRANGDRRRVEVGRAEWALFSTAQAPPLLIGGW